MKIGKFKEVLSFLKEGDTLVVTKLDCFASSTVDAIQIVKGLFEKEVKIRTLNMGLVEYTPTGPADRGAVDRKVGVLSVELLPSVI